MMSFRVTKTITHEQGYSAAFRQWSADSHCRFVHGYALSVVLIFESETLNAQNWVIDFGSFKPLRQIFEDQFDHKTIIAADDPLLPQFQQLAERGGIDLRIMSNVGCEAFAQWVADTTNKWLDDQNLPNAPRLVSVEVREHGSNSATVVL